MWAAIGPFLALGVFVGYVIARYVPVIERNAFEIPRHRPPHHESDAGAADAVEVEIPGPDGLISVHRIAAPSARGLVIFCHETDSDWKSWRRHAGFLPAAGYEVLAFDYETSDRVFQWPCREEAARVRSVVEWAAWEHKGLPIVLLGVSKGSVLAASIHHPAVGGLILDGAFSTFATLESYMQKWVGIYVTQEGIARGIPGWAYRALSRLAVAYAGARRHLRFFSIESGLTRLRRPVLMIHAANDYFVRLADVERLRHLLDGHSSLWIAQNAAHSESALVEPDEYRKRILAFLAQTVYDRKKTGAPAASGKFRSA